VDIVIQALVMGLVQGLTEFLPVSSSGHLILVPFLMGWDDAFLNSLEFSVMLHLGTLAALLGYFRADWLRLVPAGLASLRDRSFGDDPDRRLAWLIAVASIPALVLGFLLNDLVSTRFREVGLVALALVVGGAILWLAERWGTRTRAIGGLGFGGALGIGLAQAAALVPGISRSGISISAGLFAGLERESAARFSFLLATPAILGAGLLKGAEAAVEGIPAEDIDAIIAGATVSAVVGWLSIRFLLRLLQTGTFTPFVIYRLLVGTAIVVYFSV